MNREYCVPAAVMLAVVVLAICSSAFGQQLATPLVNMVTSQVPFGAMETFSQDGQLMAHFGNEYPAALYVKSVVTGEDKLITKGPDGPAAWMVVSGLSFSPDGGLVLFEAGPARPFNGDIYTAKVDGSGVSVLASDIQSTNSKASGKGGHDIGMSGPCFSPDSKRVAVEVEITNGKRDDQGRFDHSEDTTYIGMLSAEEQNQLPQILREGRPLFWSTDGKAIYYRRKGQLIYQFDIASKQSRAIEETRNIASVVGRAPGTDTIFVKQPMATSVTVLNLDGAAPSPELTKIAASIPTKDSEGRKLRTVEAGGPHQFLITYEANIDTPPGIPRIHAQLISFQ